MSRMAPFFYGVLFGYVHYGLSLLAGLVLTPILLNELGVHILADWYALIQVLGYIGLTDLGISALLMRRIAAESSSRDQEYVEPPRILGTALAFRVVVSIVGVAVVLTLYQWEALPSLLQRNAWILVAVFLIQPFQVFVSFLQGLQDFRYLGWLQVGSLVVNSCFLVYASHYFKFFWVVPTAWLVSQFLVNMGGFVRVIFLYGAVPILRMLWNHGWSGLSEFRSRGVWITLNQGSHLAINQSDSILIRHFTAPVGVVSFNFASKLCNSTQVLPQTILQTALPGLSDIRNKENGKAMGRVMAALITIICVLIGTISCVVLSINEVFVTTWVGSLYQPTLLLTLPIVLNFFFRHLASLLGSIAFTFRQEKAFTWIGVGDVLISIAMSILLIPVVGISGLALAQLIGICLFALPLYFYVLTRGAEDFRFRYCLPGLMSAGLMISFGILMAWRAPQLPFANPAKLLLLTSVSLSFCLLVSVPAARSRHIAPYFPAFRKWRAA